MIRKAKKIAIALSLFFYFSSPLKADDPKWMPDDISTNIVVQLYALGGTLVASEKFDMGFFRKMCLEDSLNLHIRLKCVDQLKCADNYKFSDEDIEKIKKAFGYNVLTNIGLSYLPSKTIQTDNYLNLYYRARLGYKIELVNGGFK